jgi:hypothetical protein
LHESLAMLGFNVKELGQPGEPEGIATAIMSTDSESKSRDYSLTYDAKSSKDVVDTGNVGVAGLARHRDRYRADYVLVVGPAFRSGALESECAANRVTPMTCNDLAKLLRLTATYGRIPLDRLVSLFSCYSPNRVRGLGHET